MRRHVLALLGSLLVPACGGHGADATDEPSAESSEPQWHAPGEVPMPSAGDPHATGAAVGDPHASEPQAGGGDPHATAPASSGAAGTDDPAAVAAANPAPPFDPARPAVGGVRWTAPNGFAHRAPSVPMRVAEYVVGRDGANDVAMTVFHFPGMGGSVDSNLTRWLGQFRQPDGRSTLSVARITTESVGGFRITTVDVGGTFDGGSMGGGSGENHRMLGAILEAPDGPVFFKLVGPRSVVDAAEPGFRTLLSSVARTTP